MHDEYQNYQNGSSVSERQQFVGELTGQRRDRLAEVKVKNRFGLGDHMELMTHKGEAIEVAPGDGHTVYLPIPDAVDLAFGLLMREWVWRNHQEYLPPCGSGLAREGAGTFKINVA